MIRARLVELRERQVLLAARAQLEREELAIRLERADAALVWLARGRDLVAEVRRRPLLLAAAVLLVMAWRPRRVLKLLASGWSLWRLYRRAQRWWERIAPLAGNAAGGRP